MLSQLKRRFDNAVLNWMLRYDGNSFARRYNFFRKTLGFASEITWDEPNKLYKISDWSGSLFISRKSRLRYYKQGVRNRLDFLANEYLCDCIDFSDGDLLIDVGANIGEFSRALSSDKHLRVLAFEPEIEEFRALRLNLGDVASEVYDKPLWSVTCEMEFFPSNETGDSSLIRQNEDSKPVQMKCLSLDDVLSESLMVGKADKIKLLKLEAEGAEPEILQGMKQNLGRVEYVSADVGAERGFEKESTLIAVQNILMEAGFEPVKFGLPRAVMLFHNTRMKGG